MSIQTFLKSLMSSPTRRRVTRRPAPRLCLEPLEDRCLLSFSVGGEYPFGAWPGSMVSADFNGDGRADLAVASSTYVYVRFADANGTLSGGMGGPTGGGTLGTVSIAAGDFNGDGTIDLAMANEQALPTVLLNNGTGTFAGPYSVPIAELEVDPNSGVVTSYYALRVVVADANADGLADLLFSGEAWFSPYDDGAVILPYAAASLGRGDGTFAPSFGDTNGGGSLSAGDLNADGKVDMVWPDSVRHGLGNGRFNPSEPISPATSGDSVALDDFNGDGKLDLATTNAYTGNGYVELSNGNGTFQPAQSYVSGVKPVSIATADFNGDGKRDLATLHRGDGSQNQTVTVRLGNGNGTFQAPLTFPGAPQPFGTHLTVGDFNSDGRTDIAFAINGATVRVLTNDGNWSAEPPAVSISDVTVTEGNTGTRAVSFTVTLSAAYGQPFSVAYATANGTATAGSDYQAASGTLTIPAGQTTGTITVLVNGDRLAEPNETYFVNLSNATNATIADGQGVGTITDDEPLISISDVIKSEGRKGKTTLFTFTVTLSAAYDRAVTMSFKTVNGTAKTSNSDYIAKTGRPTFAPGETTKTITIEVKGDSRKEANETFYLDLFGLSPGAPGFTKNRGLGTILNDD